MIEEKIQYQARMTPAQASGVRARRIYGKELSNEERREAERLAKEKDAGKWTVDRLWKAYRENRSNAKSFETDKSRFDKYLKEPFGAKEPGEIIKLDMDRMRINLGKTLKPQTVKHVLNLLDRIINFGLKSGQISQGLKFKIQKPTVHNLKTEDLNDEQIRNLFAAIEADKNLQVGNMLKLALYTGMRRGEIFKLKWEDVDFQRNLITIRNPKGGRDQAIPINIQARELLKNYPQVDSPFVFPTGDGRQRSAVHNQVRRIRESAGLPKDFRPFHGLRHVFASMLASSGQVDMYTLQKLLTHKSPVMTQRYAHLRDEAIRRAAAVAGDLIGNIMKKKDEGQIIDLEKA